MQGTASSRVRVLVNALSVTIGGGRSYALNLIRELDRADRGLDVTVIAGPGALAELQTRSVRIRVVAIPAHAGPGRLAARLLSEYIWLPWVARRYDVLFSIADLSPPIALAPCVVALTNLNVYDRRFYDNVRTRLLALLARLGASRAARIIVATRGAADQIREHLEIPEQKLRIVPHGIDPGSFEATDLPAADRPFLLIAGAVERHKNLEVAVDAMAILRDPNLELRLAGPSETDMEYAGEIRSRIRGSGAEERIHLLGVVPYQRISGLYRAARALVFPSKLETFGHPVLEGMAFGTPLVLSDIPAFRELAGDAALYFDPDDPNDLAAALEMLDERPQETKRRVELGRERVRRFTWERSVDLLGTVLR